MLSQANLVSALDRWILVSRIQKERRNSTCRILESSVGQRRQRTLQTFICRSPSTHTQNKNLMTVIFYRWVPLYSKMPNPNSCSIQSPLQTHLLSPQSACKKFSFFTLKKKIVCLVLVFRIKQEVPVLGIQSCDQKFLRRSSCLSLHNKTKMDVSWRVECSPQSPKWDIPTPDVITWRGITECSPLDSGSDWTITRPITRRIFTQSAACFKSGFTNYIYFVSRIWLVALEAQSPSLID